MPFRFTFFPSEKLIWVFAEEQIDFPSSVAAMRALVAEPQFEPAYKVVVDLRQAIYHPTVTDLASIRNGLIGHADKFKGGVTLLVPESLLSMAKLFCILAEVYQFEIAVTTTLEPPR